MKPIHDRANTASIKPLIPANVRLSRWLLTAFLVLFLGACAGSKVLRHPLPMPETGMPLERAARNGLELELTWVIVRDGPGSWARNADWDEYLLSARNVGNGPLTLIRVEVHDSQGVTAEPGQDRAELVKASKATAKRYREEGIEVRAGLGGATLAAAGGASYLAGSAVGVAVLTGSAGAGAAGVAIGALAAAPVLAGAGMVRGINNSAVNKALKARQTPLPVTLAPGDRIDLDLFYPIAPSPRLIRASYHYEGRPDAYLDIKQPASLAGLHLAPGAKPAR